MSASDDHDRPETSRRVNSLYDLTSLRLHPDGLRAQPLRTRIWKGHSHHEARPVRDARGNIFAGDAGGRYDLSKARKRSKGNEQDEDEDDDEEDYKEALEDDDEDGSDDLRDPRARARRAFYNDFSFLDEPEDREREDMRRLYHPSSDLMKFIHYYASKMYYERGELFDPTVAELRPDRPRKRQRTAASLATSSPARSSSSSSSSSDDEQDQAEEDEVPTQAEEVEEVDAESAERTEKLRRWKKRTGLKRGRPITSGAGVRRRKSMQKDENDDDGKKRNMYRALDGSALFCIALLVQEHVAKLIDTPPNLEIENANAEDETLHNLFRHEAQRLEDDELDDVEREAYRRYEAAKRLPLSGPP